ncbi:MAG: ABC-2 transporter permease [Thermomicrobiales bacterium]
MRIRLTYHHLRMQVREVVRAPGFLVPIFLFPSMFFMFFAYPTIETEQDANLFLACYVLYAILGVVFYLLLGEIADDHRNAWDDYLQTLPYGSWTRISGWFLTAAIAAVVAVVLLCITAFASTPVHLGIGQWLLLLVVGMIGAIPHALLGACIGYWIRPKFAYPAGNVVYFTLVYVGGLWTLPRGLPDWVDWFSSYVPTRMWGARLGHR